MNNWNSFISILNEIYSGQIKVTENGSKLYKNVPHVAPLAYFHKVFRSLSDEEIFELGEDLKVEIPQLMGDFLQVANGLSLFSGNVSLYGKRGSFSRDIKIAQQEPFSILTPNISERIACTEDYIFIGSIGGDRKQIFINGNYDKVHVCEKNNIKIIHTWPSLYDLIYEVFDCLVKCYDAEGVKISTAELYGIRLN